MSYDLVVEGERWRRLHEDLSASPNGAACELRPSNTSLVVALPRHGTTTLYATLLRIGTSRVQWS